MVRQLRLIPDVGFLHVMARGNNKRRIFLYPKNARVFYSAMLKLKKEDGIKILHYVIMPSHVHLLVGVNETSDLSRFMMRLKLIYSNFFRKKYSYVGHLWQGRFRSKLIDNDLNFIQCGKYIALNPVRAGIVAEPGAYKFSSYNYYATGKKDNLVDVDPLYLNLSDSEDERRRIYRNLIIDEVVTEKLNCSENFQKDSEEEISDLTASELIVE